MNLLFPSAVAATALVAGSAASAQPPTPPAPRHAGFFDAMDANKDGVVTRAELNSVLDQRFAAVDTDRNGVLSPAERNAASDAVREQRFNMRFDAADADKSGQLSRDELRAAHGHAGKGPEADVGSPDGPGRPRASLEMGHHGHREWRGHRDAGPGAAVGDVTREAYRARPLRQFDLLDSNDDGRITVAERDAARPPAPHPQPRLPE